MKILAIETSCDETAVALLEVTGPPEKPDIKILGNTLLSQMALHAPYGGVYPNLAKREHQKNLPPLLAQTLSQAHVDTECPQIDCIAVTVGPGLEPALWTGITFAQDLGKRWSKPVVGINHMEGHIWSILYGESPISNSQFSISNEIKLPALALLVSGGHTELVSIKNFGDYEILGRTLDDAVGEAYDKVARMLGLPYPGGPEISRLAEKTRNEGREPSFKFPRPMIHSHDLNFSFSGLKTAVLYKIRGQELTPEFKEEVARAFEDAAVEVLVSKTREALENLVDIQTLIVAGGVSANTYLRASFENLLKKFPNVQLYFPEKLLTTDNAIMIGLAAYIKISTFPNLLSYPQALIAQGNLSLSSQ